MQNYKSLRVGIMICATLGNTHRHVVSDTAISTSWAEKYWSGIGV